MAFYTSLTGLNAATTQLGVTSNNIANVSTTGFKRSRADFGDIFATSPLQKASTVIGKGTALKQVSQEFSQGNIELSGNTLDLAVTGEGFFPLESSDGQSLYTRNGSFLLDEKNRVSNSAGQFLMVAKVDSLGKADFDSDLQTLTIQNSTIGEAVATSQIDLAVNFPADAPVAPQVDDNGNPIVDAQNKIIPKPFDPNDPSTYAKSSAITVYDDNGNDYLATIYYARTQTATASDPENKWQTYVYLGDQLIEPALSQATSAQGELFYVNKYGQIEREQNIPVNERSTNATFQKFNLDDLSDPIESTPAEVKGNELNATTFPYQASLGPLNFTYETAGLSSTDIQFVGNTDGTVPAGETAVTDLLGLVGFLGAASSDIEPYLAPEEIDEMRRWPTADDPTDVGQINGTSVPLDGETAYKAYKKAELKALVDAWNAETDATAKSTKKDAVDDWLLERQFHRELQSAMTIAVDVPAAVGADTIDDYEITIDLESIVGSLGNDRQITGKTLANELTREINRQTGSQRYFDMSSASDGKFTVTAATVLNKGPEHTIEIDIATDLAGQDLAALTPEQVAQSIERQLNKQAWASAKEEQAAGGGTVADYLHAYQVEYSPENAGFNITRSDNTSINLRATSETVDGVTSQVSNGLFGLVGATIREINPQTGFFTVASNYDVTPNGNPVVAEDKQRYGLEVNYEEATNSFSVRSGTTGDESNIYIYNVAAPVQNLLGLTTDATEFSDADIRQVSKDETEEAERGLISTPAQVTGNPLAVNTDGTFTVTDFDNEFSVTVDSVTQTFKIPAPADYTLQQFMETLENRINAMADSAGNTVNGVVVDYNPTLGALTFETGTTGDQAFLQITGNSRYGLQGLEPGLGATSTWVDPIPVKEARNLTADVYVRFNNATGKWEEYSAASELGLPLEENQQFDPEEQPKWRPLFLDKGELTFDTSGRLISPVQGIELDNVVIGSSGNTLQIDIDYTGSTQFTGEFSVNSQSQNGKPNGSLVGLDIADDGLVTASYSNGTQDLKGKIVLSNFSTPNGLRQLGDSTFLESAESGTAQLGEPGSAGYGSIRAGARERANLDLTSELVDLITAQRNFQANAKGLETSSTLTTTIINIRG